MLILAKEKILNQGLKFFSERQLKFKLSIFSTRRNPKSELIYTINLNKQTNVYTSNKK